jgi:hypothetical protein
MNKEATKEKLSWLRLLLTLDATINTVCIAWFINN